MAKQYAKVTLLEGRQFYIEITSESDLFVTGWEVNREGNEIVPKGIDSQGRKFERRMRIIDKAVIKRSEPHRMNNHYGELEPIKEGQS